MRETTTEASEDDDEIVDVRKAACSYLSAAVLVDFELARLRLFRRSWQQLTPIHHLH